MVGAGGFVGAVLRHLAGGFVQRTSGSAFPFGTLAVNVVGCLAIGFVMARTEAAGGPTPTLRLFLIVGVLGGFTTFSAFGFDTLQLARSSSVGAAVTNVSAQVGLGLAAVMAGIWLGRSTAA